MAYLHPRSKATENVSRCRPAAVLVDCLNDKLTAQLALLGFVFCGGSGESTSRLEVGDVPRQSPDSTETMTGSLGSLRILCLTQ